jgi:hypothetical protein
MNPFEKCQHPDYPGIEGALKYLMETAADLKQEVLELRTRLDLKAYTLKEIAAGLGYSVSHLKASPWKLPNYGRPDEGSNPGRWYYQTIVNWLAIPEDERRFKWESMSSTERRREMGRLPKEGAV